MAEQDEKQRLQEIGTELLSGLHALTRVLVLYDANNAAVGRVTEGMQAALRRFLADEEVLTLQLLSDEFFVNGRLLRVDAQVYERGRECAEILEGLNINEVRFHREHTAESFRHFITALGGCLRGSKTTLGGPYTGIETNRIRRAASAAAFRFEPDRLAVWLYASLLDVTERLFADHAAGKSPSLRPLRRVLQLIIDGMRDHSGVYQMLSVVREPGRPVSPAQLRAAMCIDAIGFGRFVELSGNDTMTLALCGLLGGLSETPDPDEAVRPLFGYSGLGDAAMPLILTLHDTRATRAGKPGGVPGRMLAVVETYHELITDPRSPLPLPTALKEMVSGALPHVEVNVARTFRAYKGEHPIGSIVQLSDRRPALVLSQGQTAASKARPVVGLINSKGVFSGRLDLQAHPDLQIKRAFTPEQTRLRYEKL